MFRFKQFEITDNHSAMKIGTDGVLLGAWALQDCPAPVTVIDAGCGSGLIALMLAQRFDNSHITGIEIEPEAAGDAILNVQNSPWSERVDIINCNFLDHIGSKVDAIVSNPPFFSNALASPGTQRCLARHDNSLPLQSLAVHAAQLLNNDGTLSVILPYDRLDEYIYTCAQQHLDVYKVTTVSATTSSPPLRVMVEAIKGTATKYITRHIAVKDADRHQYTATYRLLTHQFYLDSTFQ